MATLILAFVMPMHVLAKGKPGGNGNDFVFTVIGDTAYGGPLNFTLPDFEVMIDEINDDADNSFTIHVGDLKGAVPCTREATFDSRLAFFQSFEAPLIYTPDHAFTMICPSLINTLGHCAQIPGISPPVSPSTRVCHPRDVLIIIVNMSHDTSPSCESGVLIPYIFIKTLLLVLSSITPLSFPLPQSLIACPYPVSAIFWEKVDRKFENIFGGGVSA